MAKQTVCDGCGKLAPDAQVRGRIRPLDYCPSCAMVVDALRSRLSAFRVRLAEQWAEELASAEAEARALCPDMKFPL